MNTNTDLLQKNLTVAPSTLRKYLSHFKKLCRHLVKTVDSIQATDLTNYDKIKEFFDNLPSIQARKDYFNSFKRCALCLEIYPTDERYDKLYATYCLFNYKASNFKKASKQELAKHSFTMKDVSDLRELCKSKLKPAYNRLLDTRYLIYSLYSLYPPLRPQEWRLSIIIKDLSKVKMDTNYNYICLSTNRLICNIHKNNKYVKCVRTLKLPDDLVDIIRGTYERSKCHFLIPNHTMEREMSPSNFSKLMKRTTKDNRFIAYAIRRIWCSEFTDSEPTTQKRKDMAFILDHSPFIQMSVYSKFSKLLHANDLENRVVDLEEQIKLLTAQLKG